MRANYQAFDHAAVWQGADLASKDSLAIDLEQRHVDALDGALDALRARKNFELSQLRRADFPLESISRDVTSWRHEMRDGRGLILLRGFPLDGYGVEEIELMYYGLGLHLGRAVSQSNMGDLIGHVVNVGGKDSRERAYRNSVELRLHTDLCDHVAMLCLQPAWEGGVSAYASGLTVHNEILANQPELLKPLYDGYYMHRFGQQLPGEPTVTRHRVPIFSVANGVPSVVAMRHYSDLAVDEGLAERSEIESEALDYFDQVAARSDLRVEFTLERGELMLSNNCLVLHSRSGFEDHPHDAAKRRHLLRLWLRDDERPALDSVHSHKGNHGVAEQDGRGTYYRGAGTPS